jgi:hypothetical protein
VSAADSRPGLRLVAAAIGRARRATDSGDARSGAHVDALWRTHEHSGAIIGNQQHSSSNHEQSGPLGRPTPSPHAVVLGEGAAASSATDCLAIFTTTLRKPSRIVIARDGAP